MQKFSLNRDPIVNQLKKKNEEPISKFLFHFNHGTATTP